MAIQVAGTPIITDAKALNGITSIDSTTASAIASGGVGASYTQITTANVGSVSEVWIPLSTSYEEHLVVLDNVDVVATNWTGMGYRYGGTSASTLSTAHIGIRNSTTESALNSSLLQTQASIRVGANYTSSFNAYLRIYDAASSSKRTRTFIEDAVNRNGQWTGYNLWVISQSKESNQYIRLKWEVYSSGWNFRNQGSYTVYGR